MNFSYNKKIEKKNLFSVVGEKEQEQKQEKENREINVSFEEDIEKNLTIVRFNDYITMNSYVIYEINISGIKGTTVYIGVLPDFHLVPTSIYDYIKSICFLISLQINYIDNSEDFNFHNKILIHNENEYTILASLII